MEFLKLLAKRDVSGIIFTDMSTDNLKIATIGIAEGNSYYMLVLYDMRLEIIKTTKTKNHIQTYIVNDPLIIEVIKKNAMDLATIKKEVLRHLLKVSTLIEDKVVYRKLETIKRVRRRGLI